MALRGSAEDDVGTALTKQELATLNRLLKKMTLYIEAKRAERLGVAALRCLLAWLRTEESLAVLFTPANFGPDVPDDARFARNAPCSLRSPGAVVGAIRPIAGRLAALGKTGSLRSHRQPMTDASGAAPVTSVASKWMGAQRPGLSRAKPALPAIGPMAVTTAPMRAQRARRPASAASVVADWGRSSPG